MFDAFISTDIEMPFTGREKELCVLLCARSQANKTVQHVFVREFSKHSPTAIQIWTWHKKLKEEGCLCRRKGSEETVERVCKKIVTKNKSRNSDFTNNSLAHPEKTLDNKTLQDTTHSGHDGRGQAKAQTELTCAVSQAERMLNMCEIGYIIHISLNFSFYLGGIILILSNIKPVWFHQH